jgi:hypothetical protein
VAELDLAFLGLFGEAPDGRVDAHFWSSPLSCSAAWRAAGLKNTRANSSDLLQPVDLEAVELVLERVEEGSGRRAPRPACTRSKGGRPPAPPRPR